MVGGLTDDSWGVMDDGSSVTLQNTAFRTPTNQNSHGHHPTAVRYPPTAVCYSPTAVCYPPTAVRDPPTAAGHPTTAIGDARPGCKARAEGPVQAVQGTRRTAQVGALCLVPSTVCPLFVPLALSCAPNPLCPLALSPCVLGGHSMGHRAWGTGHAAQTFGFEFDGRS